MPSRWKSGPNWRISRAMRPSLSPLRALLSRRLLAAALLLCAAQPLHAVNDAETHRIADVRLQHLDDMLSPVARKGDDSTSQFILFRQYDIHFPYAGWRLYDNFNIFQLYIPHNRSPPQPLRLWISCIPCTVWLPAPVDSHLPAASSPICSRQVCITFSEEGSMLLLYTQEEGTHC